MASKKGYYIKSSKRDNNLILNICIDDFIAFIKEIPTNDGWVKMRIYEKDSIDERGFTHNMEVIYDRS